MTELASESSSGEVEVTRNAQLFFTQTFEYWIISLAAQSLFKDLPRVQDFVDGVFEQNAPLPQNGSENRLNEWTERIEERLNHCEHRVDRVHFICELPC